MRSLIILMMAVLFLSGLSLFTIFDATATFRDASHKLDLQRNHVFEVKFALEQAAVSFDASIAGKTDSKQSLQLKKAKASFLAAVDQLRIDQSSRPWLSKVELMKTSFELLEPLAVPSQKEAYEKQLNKLRASIDGIQNEMTDSSEFEVFESVRYLVYLIAAVAFGTIVIPAGTFWLTTQKINSDLSSFVHLLYDFSAQNDETSEELRSASQSLSSSSSEQSASVQQSVSAITEMRSMLGQTGNHVREVQNLTSAMNQKAQDGSQIMARMESSMAAIEQANHQLESFEEILQSIRGKTQVINDIVFKTQLLSFNASIEAARAGQYGRGFAVVAEEVGKLAQMSGDASKEIDQLLGHSQDRVVKIVEAVQERVSEGKGVTGEASKRFSDFARQVSIITEKINQVGDASAEQAGGVEQTARAMDQMNTSATENRASSDEIYQVAEKLRDLSIKIRGVTEGIRRFVREENSDAPATPRKEVALAETDEGFEVEVKDTPNANSAGILNIVERLTLQKGNELQKIPKLKTADSITADDPSFRKQG